MALLESHVGVAERVVQLAEAVVGVRVVGYELGENADVEYGLARLANVQIALRTQLVYLRRPRTLLYKYIYICSYYMHLKMHKNAKFHDFGDKADFYLEDLCE